MNFRNYFIALVLSVSLFAACNNTPNNQNKNATMEENMNSAIGVPQYDSTAPEKDYTIDTAASTRDTVATDTSGQE